MEALPSAATLTDLFGAVARAHPGSVAIEAPGESLTYRQVDAASDEIAGRVRAAAGPGARFAGVVVDRTSRAIVTVLGVLKAGLAYVPLDPDYPAERLQHMIRDADLPVVLGRRDVARSFTPAGRAIVDPAEPGGNPAAVPGPAPGTGPDDPAYVIYTSGSTGTPKGCVVTHGNVLAMLRASLPLLGASATDRWSLFHSMSFDFSVWELWGPIASAATSVVVPVEVAKSPDEFAAFLDAEKITVLSQVPSVFRYLAMVCARTGHRPGHLRTVVFGGESVDGPTVRDFLALPGGPRPEIINMYGITEITVHATFKRMADADLDGAVRSPIGRPLPHLRISIRDEDGREVRSGAVGELWIAGAGVAAGYLNRPDLTAQRFVTLDGDRYYRSGDLGRLRPDGELEYAGRADEQVKILGFRVELGEIEAVLRDHVDIEDALVALAPTASGAPSLVACVVPRSFDVRDLPRSARAHLAGFLPSHMIPDRFRIFPAFPLGPSGKTDRRAVVDAVRGTGQSRTAVASAGDA